MQVVKRDGRVAEFDTSKIKSAIIRCLREDTSEFRTEAEDAVWNDASEYAVCSNRGGGALTVEEALDALVDLRADAITKAAMGTLSGMMTAQYSIETIQSAVIDALLQHDPKAAVRYAEYKGRHDAVRGRDIPVDVRAAFDSNKKWFPTALQEFQYLDKYARWDDSKGRREVWEESVERAHTQLGRFVGERARALSITDRLRLEVVWGRDSEGVKEAILRMATLPSMRLLAMAGPAVERNNASQYNCSYAGVDNPYTLVEALVLLMCGCGFGFSVEDKFISQLPPVDAPVEGTRVADADLWVYGDITGDIIKPETHEDGENGRRVHVVEDSSEGWARALSTGLCHWWRGLDYLVFDYSNIRPAGARLQTKGGTASGPDPLKRLLDRAREMILAARGRKLTSLEVYDLVCTVADCVVCGGVRRSALICMFDWDDTAMRLCKSGQWLTKGHPDYQPQRQNSNNSAVIPRGRRLSQAEVCELFVEMYRSGSGEPGAISRYAAVETMSDERRKRTPEWMLDLMGFNPCSEIFLRHMGFCNLSIAVARASDTLADLEDKVRIATIIGTIQACATKFSGLRDQWTTNASEERLIGVDITNQQQRPLTAEEMDHLNEVVYQTNKLWAELLGIPCAAALTCNKPSGNSSVLLNCSPGINPHPGGAQNIRHVTVSSNTAMYRVLKDAGVRLIQKPGEDDSLWLAAFPQKAEVAGISTEFTAKEQLDVWKRNKLHWCRRGHNPSTSITFRANELLDMATWFYENQNIASGLAFFPAWEGAMAELSVFSAVPYIPLDEDTYAEFEGSFPDIDFAQLYVHETEDETTTSMELACSGGMCTVSF